MRPTQVIIDIDALHHNLKRVHELVPSPKVVAMVKANAYGHGLDIVAPSIADQTDYFGVALAEEAMQIRGMGINSPILVAEGFFTQEELLWMSAHRVDTVIHNTWQLETLLRTPLKQSIRVWIKFDSGMHRLGFKKDGFLKAYKTLEKCSWVKQPMTMMTHLASAAKKADPQTKSQLTYFKEVTGSLKGPKSVGNSAAICSQTYLDTNIVRPGIMLYGGSPLSYATPDTLGLKPVMTFSTAIIAIRACEKGGAVGYDATWRSDKKSLIATLPVGYGDGYPRHLSKEAYVLIKGQKAPVVGRVSMDMLTVDVTDIQDVQCGDRVLLWGPGLPCHELAKAANTIDYDLFCRASLRVTPGVMPARKR